MKINTRKKKNINPQISFFDKITTVFFTWRLRHHKIKHNSSLVNTGYANTSYGGEEIFLKRSYRNRWSQLT